MNQTTDKKITNTTTEERALLLVEIAKDLAAVEEEGFGRIVIEVKNNQIVNWWKVSSRTARGFWRKLRGDVDHLTS
jgi:myo-inositol catabolism protein IolC